MIERNVVSPRGGSGHTLSDWTVKSSSAAVCVAGDVITKYSWQRNASMVVFATYLVDIARSAKLWALKAPVTPRKSILILTRWNINYSRPVFSFNYIQQRDQVLASSTGVPICNSLPTTFSRNSRAHGSLAGIPNVLSSTVEGMTITLAFEQRFHPHVGRLLSPKSSRTSPHSLISHTVPDSSIHVLLCTLAVSLALYCDTNL